MNILVTGATGYFGAAIVKELLSNPSNRIISLVRDEEKFLKLKQWCEADNLRLSSLTGDINSIDHLPEHIDTIVHAAGIIEAASDIHEEDYIRINSKGTENILELARQCEIKQFIFI